MTQHHDGERNAPNDLAARHSGLRRVEGDVAFRDLNKNGRLDIYEDPRQPIEARVEDLLGQMTLAEKAGMMFINGAAVNDDGSIERKHGGAAGIGAGLIAAEQMTGQ